MGIGPLQTKVKKGGVAMETWGKDEWRCRVINRKTLGSAVREELRRRRIRVKQ